MTAGKLGRELHVGHRWVVPTRVLTNVLMSSAEAPFDTTNATGVSPHLSDAGYASLEN